MNILDKKSVSDVIHQFYKLQGYKFEWSLSYNSFNILHTPEYPIAFIGLNPGGDEKTKYNPEMLDKERILVISKCDMLDDELKAELKVQLDKDFANIPYMLISSVAQQGLTELKDKLWQMLNRE